MVAVAQTPDVSLKTGVNLYPNPPDIISRSAWPVFAGFLTRRNLHQLPIFLLLELGNIGLAGLVTDLARRIAARHAKSAYAPDLRFGQHRKHLLVAWIAAWSL